MDILKVEKADYRDCYQTRRRNNDNRSSIAHPDNVSDELQQQRQFEEQRLAAGRDVNERDFVVWRLEWPILKRRDYMHIKSELIQFMAHSKPRTLVRFGVKTG
jgi:hypothetical protein